MKKLLFIFACSGIVFAQAQNNVNITSQQYDNLKQSGQLDKSKHYVFSGNSTNLQRVKPSLKVLSSRTPSSICSCLIPLDSSFSVVPFLGSYSSPAGAPDYRNDDGSSPLISLPFTFNFFGVNYDSLFINNNGNISFVSPYFEFTADSFPTTDFNMIAPFWGDVDTRDSASGLVYYKITPTAMIIKWENVGYYDTQSDKLNTFQLIITNGADSLLPSGNNVSFCYGDMQWTTGSASGGENGFGGIAATVGVNQGNGTDYFQVGRFDHAGTTFDGPYNQNDSVDFLDNQGMYFNVASVGNIPPVIINNTICDTIDVYTGDTTHSVSQSVVTFKIGVSTPEINQIANATITCSQADHFSYYMSLNTPTYKEYTCTFNGENLPENLYFVNVTATDNGTPVMQTVRTLVIKNRFVAGIHESSISAITIYPNPTDGYINVNHKFNPASHPVLSIENVIGQNVMTTALNSQEQTVDMASLSKGVYFATITSKEGKSKTFKIVKK